MGPELSAVSLRGILLFTPRSKLSLVRVSHHAESHDGTLFSQQGSTLFHVPYSGLFLCWLFVCRGRVHLAKSHKKEKDKNGKRKFSSSSASSVVVVVIVIFMLEVCLPFHFGSTRDTLAVHAKSSATILAGTAQHAMGTRDDNATSES